jgi:putative ABC transport system permease protein
MKLYQLALRELSRRKIRTLYTASSITLSVALLAATVLLGAAGQKDLMLIIARYGHSLTIFPATSNEVSLRQFGIGTGHYIPESSIPEIQRVYEHAIRAGWRKRGALLINDGTPGGIDEIQPAVFMPRLYEQTTIAGRPVIVTGVVPEDEYKARFWWEVDEGRLVSRPDEVMVGKAFADAIGVGAGGALAINGRSFRVSGVLRETNSPDDYMVFATLTTVQETFGKEGLVSMLNVRAMCNYCPVGEAELEINKKVVGVRATSQREIAEAQHRIFRNVTSVVLGLVLLSLGIACMAMFNMIMGNIHNRMRDAGLFKMLGASRGQLMRLFMYEAIAMGFFGGLAGYLLGLALAHALAPWLLPQAVIETRWWHALAAAAIAILASVAATVYPAWHVARLRVADAFRAL